MSNPKDFIYMCKISELADWRPEDIEIQASNVSNTPLLARPQLPQPIHLPTATPSPIPNLLNCHYYGGGYCPDESAQGQFAASSRPGYTAAHLHLIDTFVYDSDHLVSIPPSPWINTLHRNGVPVLGTFNAEGDAGSTALSRLLDKGSEGEYIFATQMALIAETYGFDGWLVCIQAPSPEEHLVPGELEAFLKELRSAVKELVPGGLVIWFDSLTVLNKVNRQKGLTQLNAPFFKVTDGMFACWGWRGQELGVTSGMARTMNRVRDIYTGVDCFDRGSNDGDLDVGKTLSLIREAGTSVALFAPGWAYEGFGGKDFESIDRKFWVGDGSDAESNPIKPISYFVSHKACGGPEFFFTNFNRGFGKGWWVNGVKAMDTPWMHIGAQSILPSRNSRNTDNLKWSFTDETAYFGGTSLNVSIVAGRVAGGVDFCPLYSTAITANGSSIQVAYLLPERSPNEILEGEVVGVYYTSDATQAKTLLPLPQGPRGGWKTTTFLPVVAGSNKRITELGIYYKHPAVPTSPGFRVLVLGTLHISPVPTIPERPSRITEVVSLDKGDGNTKLSWKAYKCYFSPVMRKLRSVHGCFSGKTGDFSSFLVWRGKELVGVSYCLEYDVPAGMEAGDWRADGVTWGGAIVRGGGGREVR